LTNLALAFFQEPGVFVSRRMFPVVPVPLSSARFYEFDKGDLARDNVRRKPEFGHVAPVVFGKRDHYYHCEPDQVITGIDMLSALDFRRANTPGAIDPRRAKVRFVAEQLAIHMDRVWAEKYFHADAWGNVMNGTAVSPAGDEFIFFDNENCDPVRMFNTMGINMLKAGLRKPNKMCLGVNAFAALQANPSILERIKYQGSEANPAGVTVNALAQLFKLSEVMVAESVVNNAPLGAPDNLQFICDPDSVLLTYTANAPAIDEPSAGYTFAWDMLGNGQYMAIQQYAGDEATHTEFVEGLVCSDARICAPDLGVFMRNAVSPDFV
jgi:hypothetical protein